MKFGHLFIAPSCFDNSLNFYLDLMGMKLLDQWGNAPHRGAVLKSEENFVVVLAEEHKDEVDNAWKKGINKHYPTIHLEVKNLENSFAHWKKSNCVVVPPESTHWGTKWFVVHDPDKNLIAINENKTESPGS